MNPRGVLTCDRRWDTTKSTLSIELGMPHLGRHNLSETALLKEIGHHRWQTIEQAGKVHSAEIRDQECNRLYATFYFIELALSEKRPLSFYGENRQLHFRSDLSHYDRVYLDGCYVLTNGGPFHMRASNVFIYQMAGPSKLATAPPANMCFDTVPKLSSEPDSLDLCRAAKKAGTFCERRTAKDLPLGICEVIYRLDPDRDLNGAGLVYFANFICFLDYAERELLGRFGMPEKLLDARSTYWRRIGYFGNAKSRDCLHITITGRLQLLGPMALGMDFDYRLRRSCDDREIVISSARKVAPMDAEDATWLNRLSQRNG
jgi:probable biosynthetic protein (TIGR04098 family)